jgi:hypothetical protein
VHPSLHFLDRFLLNLVLCGYPKIVGRFSGIARLSACYFNESIYFTNITTSFPDEIDYHGCDKGR